MAISKATVDARIRNEVFSTLNLNGFVKINDRQYGAIVQDCNGHARYVRLGVIVAEEREDLTADELMQSEINTYQEKQIAKQEKAAARAVKAEKDKAKRAAKVNGEG